jgi:hypothetical protein
MESQKGGKSLEILIRIMYIVISFKWRETI